MSGKFLRRAAIIDTLKGMEAVNSRQRRAGTRYAVRTVNCGCPDPGCGAFHVIETERPLPDAAAALATLRARKRLARRARQQVEAAAAGGHTDDA